MRKTKIICTLGPSTDKGDVLRDLIANGMNVARFNFSHGSYEEHGGRLAKLKALREELGKPVAALLDTKGPEIRLKEFKNGVEMLEAGQTFTLTTREVEGTKEICSVTYKDLPQDVQPGGTIMLDDALALAAGDDGQRVRVRAQIRECGVEPVAHRQRRCAAVDARTEHDDRVRVRVRVRARVAHDGDLKDREHDHPCAHEHAQHDAPHAVQPWE